MLDPEKHFFLKVAPDIEASSLPSDIELDEL